MSLTFFIIEKLFMLLCSKRRLYKNFIIQSFMKRHSILKCKIKYQCHQKLVHSLKLRNKSIFLCTKREHFHLEWTWIDIINEVLVLFAFRQRPYNYLQSEMCTNLLLDCILALLFTDSKSIRILWWFFDTIFIFKNMEHKLFWKMSVTDDTGKYKFHSCCM